MRSCGHEVTNEAIRAECEWNKWLLPVPLLPLLPALPLYLASSRFRRKQPLPPHLAAPLFPAAAGDPAARQR